MPVPGDVAFVRVLEDGSAVVERLEARTSALTRRTVEGRSKTMAANVDTLVTVTSLALPPPRAVILDRLLAFAMLEGIAAIVLLTKPDVAPRGIAEIWTERYERIGYQTVVVDPKHGRRVDALRACVAGRTAMLCGVSGVGKSTIFRALGGEGAVGELSRAGLGRQTTSAARLCRIDGGFLIDSPGVAEFGLGAVSARELAPAFVEMPAYARECRFADCTHVSEPGCAVRAAVESTAIDPERYASYRQILRVDPERVMVD